MNSPSSLQNQSRITLQVGAEKLSGFSGLQVERAIDTACDAFSFSVPWEPTPENIRRFRPFSADIVRVYVDDELLLTGYIERNEYTTDASQKVVNIQGRSASGTLLDWSAGPPFQFQDVTFNQFSTKLYQNFDPSARVGAAFATPDTPPISEVQITIGDKMHKIFSSIASGHGLWGIPTTTGRLEYKKLSSKAAAVAQLEEGSGPVRSVTAIADLTKRFQRYMVVGTFEGDPEATAEVQDPEIFGFAKRGRLITELSNQTTDINEAAKFSRSKALIESYMASCVVDGWRYNGALWRPGTIISLKAPGAYILKSARFMIRRVTFQIDEAGGQLTALDLSMPEAYDSTETKPANEVLTEDLEIEIPPEIER